MLLREVHQRVEWHDPRAYTTDYENGAELGIEEENSKWIQKQK